MQNQNNNAPHASVDLNKTITIIGAGNMGVSLLAGLIARQYDPAKITLTNPSEDKLKQIQTQYGVQTNTNNIIATATADIVIFAIKPQIFAQVAAELKTAIQQKKPLVISVVTGITEYTMQEWLGGDIAIIRSMPNTPVMIGCGATALFANQFVTAEQKQNADAILQSVGISLWLDQENLIDAVTALSGSGPAYYFLIMEAMQQAGERLGLPAEIARILTLQTAYGATKLASESDKNLIELRKAVTSPGGTTEQAIKVLEKANIREIIADTLFAAENRAKELSKALKA